MIAKINKLEFDRWHGHLNANTVCALGSDTQLTFNTVYQPNNTNNAIPADSALYQTTISSSNFQVFLVPTSQYVMPTTWKFELDFLVSCSNVVNYFEVYMYSYNVGSVIDTIATYPVNINIADTQKQFRVKAIFFKTFNASGPFITFRVKKFLPTGQTTTLIGGDINSTNMTATRIRIN